MENKMLPDNFKEFLELLNDRDVKYLLIRRYSVGYHGYPRTTADMNVWVAIGTEKAEKLVTVFNKFGIHSDEVDPSLFMNPGNIVRMGMAPIRIEVLNDIDGVEFHDCFARSSTVDMDGIPVTLISPTDLRANKLASGRHKDLDDLEHLPEE